MTFSDRVKRVVRGIPKGETMTYGAVACAAGSPGAGRAVGSLMKDNYDPTIPCHRVVRHDGVGQYNRGGPERKAEILADELV
jgi:methylated-DNA-[protein]-cysteine S-methyltransferase